MGVFEEAAARTPGMHWQQQHEQYLGPAYDPSRDLSPNLPSCDSSMGDGEPSGASSGSSCSSTPSNNNNNNNHLVSACGADTCRPSLPKLEPSASSPSSATPPHDPHDHHHLLHHHHHHHHHLHHHHLDDGGVASTTCAGCGRRIADRFYLQAVDRRWHAACLQCCQCRSALDGEVTCFSRDGNIYCKKDYHRLFGMKRCGRCHATILSSELVMRAREFVFHVHCFSCAVCNALLTKGDHFGMRHGEVLCRLHFEMALTEAPPPPPPPPQQAQTQLYPPPFPSPDFHPHHHHHHHHHHAQAQTQQQPPQPPPPPTLPPPTPSADPAATKVPFFNGGAPTQRQKGRPRKRKPKDIEAMTANLDLNSDYLDMPFGRSPGGGGGGHGGMGGNQRTKRMRTSFKHHQLRTMKSYFAINHNPDAKDLKQLSQKTGLPKRVLQVWFQNARAKWRRMMLKQEGKTGDKCPGSDGLSDLDLYPGPGSMAGSIHSLNAHSPPFLLPPGSPSSLDCA